MRGQSTPLGIAFIGHGAVAQYAAQRLRGDPRVQVVACICRVGREDAARADLGEDVVAISAATKLPGDVSLVVDCGGHAALRAHGPDVLAGGRDLITVSNGALAEAGLAQALEDAARTSGAQLRLLSGAIGAIDAIAAAKVGGLHSVIYTGRKPPRGWVGSAAEERVDLTRLTSEAVHFEGSARDAALAYPKNANVAATVALAGIGLDETRVRLIADPDAGGNQHVIEAEGDFGHLHFVIEGHALPGNPRSSALTAMSVVRAICDRLDPVIV